MIEADPWAGLGRFTRARIALGRTGDGLPTRRVLEFQLAHAQARDAVHLPLDTETVKHALAAFDPVLVSSQAETRETYLQRPDLGRRLDAGSRERLEAGPYAAAIVVADGLSARAVHENAPALVTHLRELLPRWRLSPVVIAEQARVALGDEIAEGLQAVLAVILIGERPGLSSANSLGAYITWRPRPGVTRDAERNCVSNIKKDGLPVNQAALRIAALMTMAQRRQLTGTTLKEDDALALFGGNRSP